ncbi:hypothetical protein [Streptomyces sp. NPDC054804]
MRGGWQAPGALAQLGRWIAVEERREAEQRCDEENRSPLPEWLVQVGPNQTPLIRAEALDALTDTRSRPAERADPTAPSGSGVTGQSRGPGGPADLEP